MPAMHKALCIHTYAYIFSRILNALENVKKQLQCLWNGPLVDHLFSPILALTPSPTQQPAGKG